MCTTNGKPFRGDSMGNVFLMEMVWDILAVPLTAVLFCGDRECVFV